MRTYVGEVDYSHPGLIGITFPDFPGCITVGRSLCEAIYNAQEALSLHIEGMLEAGLEIPEPSAFSKAQMICDNQVPVAVDVKP